MTEQQIFNFKSNSVYLEENFIKDSSNLEVFNYLSKFPSWENRLINLYGAKKSGKTFLLNILKSKENFFYLSNNEEFEKNFDNLFFKEKLIIDNIFIDEDKMFSLINNFILHNKYLINGTLILCQSEKSPRQIGLFFSKKGKLLVTFRLRHW